MATITLSPAKKKAKNGKRFNVIKKSGEVVNVTDLAIDEPFMAHFENEINEVKGWANTEIGRFENTISTKDCFFGNSAFNDLILNLELQITKADIAFNCSFGLQLVH